MSPVAQSMTALSIAAYRSYKARMRNVYRFQRYMDLIYGSHGPMLAGGTHASWPPAMRDAVRAKLGRAQEDLTLSLSLWCAGGRHSANWRAQRSNW